MTCTRNHEIVAADPGNTDGSGAPRRRGVIARGLMGAVRLYQRYISPLSGPRCRYYPSCSSYAVTAIEKHGAVKGSGLAAWRLLRCNPWSDGGVDDVPEPRPRPPKKS